MRVLPQKIVEGLATKSAKIRALDAAGLSRTEIAQFLKIRYQHMRNVLVQSGIGATRNPVANSALPPTVVEPWPLERLLEAGFQLLGECEATSEGFRYTAQAPTDAGVYAFAVDGNISYVGLTRFGLRTRLGHYVYGHAQQRTSARVKALILEALATGSKVCVLIVSPPQLEWNGLPVDGAAGLETGLIKLIRPPWNQQGH
jgi:hypothetical protein